MAARLLIGPVGSGKTTRALEAFRRFTSLQQHESVRFVVPGISQILDLRRFVLNDRTDGTHVLPGILGDPFCTFQRLAEEMVGTRTITETQKRLLLGSLPLPEHFRPSPNLPAALSTIIRTLKRSLISPDDLREAAVHLPDTSETKASALSVLYRSYEDALAERKLQDNEGLLWRALTRGVPWELVIVDGFTRLYPLYMELIRHLADACDVLITADESIDMPDAEIEYLSPPKTQNPQPTTLASLDAVASEIKRLLREGFRLDDIAVVARDTRPYQQKIARVFGEYGIQLAVEVYPLTWEGEGLGARVSSHAPERTRTSALPDHRRFYAALRARKRIMAEIEAGENLLGLKLDSRALSLAISRGTFRVSNGSGVTLSDVDMLGGREFKVIFIVGSVESRQPYEDPFLLDFERELLNPHLPRPLELSTAGQDDYDVTSSATERVYLINPELQGDLLPAIEDAETLNALRRRTILDCFNAEDDETKQTAAAAYNLLLEHGVPMDFEPIPNKIAEPLE